MLIYWADKFKEVPEHIAKRPFNEKHRVPSCESQAFVFYSSNENSSIDFYFAVENPQGISAKAVCSILQKTVSGAPPEQILAIDPNLIFTLFERRRLGMARSEGLRSIIKMIKFFVSKEFQNSN